MVHRSTADLLPHRVLDEAELSQGALYPKLSSLRNVTRNVAAAVMREAARLGLGTKFPEDEIEQVVSKSMWFPNYREYSRRQ